LSKAKFKKTISILQITDSFLPEVGGKQLVVHHLSSDLGMLDSNCYVLTNKKKGYQKTNLFYKVFYYKKVFKKIKIFFNLASIAYYVIKKEIDLIHAHRTIPAGYHAALIGRLFKIPLVITAHGDDILTVPEIKYGINLNKKSKKQSLYALRNADAVIALNEGMKDEMLKLGTNSEKIYTIPIGINLSSLKNNKKPAQKRNRGKNLVAVGRNHPVKGYENLIKAIAIVVKNNSDVQCTIIGKGTFKLNNLVSELGLQDNINLINQVDNFIERGMPLKLKKFFNASDVYISSSLSESFSLSILEAMAMGLPVISTDTIGARGLIDNNINGYIVPVDNIEIMARKIIYLINNYKLQKSFGEQARSKAKNRIFSWQDIALKHLEIYKNLILEYGNS
tara:strand:+ start:341 stop:1519 length:1179 start_codon:yes stop_codon:yes gene_type:complete